MNVPRWLALVAVAALGACDAPAPVLEPDPAPLPLRTEIVGACDLGAAAQDVLRTVDTLDRPEVLERIRGMEQACAAGDQAALATSAWFVLEVLEAPPRPDEARDPMAGMRLANRMIDCIGGLCAPSSQVPFFLALQPGGTFAVRSGGTAPALARGPVAFVDTEGRANEALWGVEVDGSWSSVTGAERILVYGWPTQQASSRDRTLGEPGYEYHTYPDVAGFADGELHVGTCFLMDVALPHDELAGEESTLPLMQRNGVMLEAHLPTFCGALAPSALGARRASALSPVLALARALVPMRVAALFSDVRAPRLGGTPLDFSIFLPTGADTNGALRLDLDGDGVFETTGSGPFPMPAAVFHRGEVVLPHLGVQAVTGAGTPMEKVRIRIGVRANRGVPAGGNVFSQEGLDKLTTEEDGAATFADLTTGKPGGYILCVEGTLEGFTFPTVCSERFHVRNRR